MIKLVKVMPVIMLFSASVFASSVNTDLHMFNAKKQNIDLPSPSVKVEDVDVIKEPHFIARAVGSKLIGWVDNEKEVDEFIKFYKSMLEKNGIKITSIKKDDSFVVINYKSEDGRVIRYFIGDRMTYNAKDDRDMMKNLDLLVKNLEENNFKVIYKSLLKTDVLRPTFIVYYMAEPADEPEKEILLRQLKNGEDIDFDVIKDSVKFVKKDSSFSLVYIGPELGFKSKIATDEKNALEKLERYKEFLKSKNKKFIGYKIKKLDKPFVIDNTVYTLLLNMYFFQ